MYNYNSWHKILIVLVVVLWAIFHFQERNEEQLRYDDGQPIRTGTTKNNLNEGIWKWYHENGELGIEGNFDKGKRTGEWRFYDTNGRMYLKSHYKNNLLNGEFVEYDTTGMILRREIYRNDRLAEKLK